MSQEKVLIVEDEENERTGLAEVLSAWGYRVETAADGVEGRLRVPGHDAEAFRFEPAPAVPTAHREHVGAGVQRGAAG